MEIPLALAKTQHWAKHFLGGLYFPRRPFKTPVFIFSTRRSASTLLMEMIAGQPGFNYHAQPLDLWLYHPNRSQIPQPPQFQYTSLTEDEAALLCRYFAGLLEGRIRFRSQWNWLSPDYHWQVDRWVVKLLNTNPLIDWFTENFDLQVVYLLRHPIPVALSILQRGWDCIAGAFLNDDQFCEQYLEPGAVRESRQILATGTPLQKYVLEWGLANAAPLRICQDRPWLTLTYEELVTRPRAVCQALAAYLDLPDVDGMVARLEQPSATTQAASRVDLAHRGPQYLLQRWQTQVDPGEARAALAPLHDLFGLGAYTWDSPYPDEDLCHFGPLETGWPPERAR